MTSGIASVLKEAGFENARNFSDIKERFIELARFIMCSHELVSEQGVWRITALELYVKTESDVWRDPYTHGNLEQRNAGTWYVHDDGGRAPNYSGIDITCGSESAGVYGGMLIRELDHEKRWNFQRIMRGNKPTFSRAGNVWTPEEKAAIAQLHRKSVETGKTYLRNVGTAKSSEQLYLGPRLGLPKSCETECSPDGICFRGAPLRIATWPTAHLKTLMTAI